MIRERQNKKLSWFTPQPEVSSVPLHFQGFFYIYNHTKLQLLKHTSLRRSCLTEEFLHNQSSTNKRLCLHFVLREC